MEDSKTEIKEVDQLSVNNLSSVASCGNLEVPVTEVSVTENKDDNQMNVGLPDFQSRNTGDFFTIAAIGVGAQSTLGEDILPENICMKN